MTMTRGRKRVSADGHKLTTMEIKRRFDERAAAIDNELNAAMKQIDWKRRKKACRSLISFINTYFVGLMVDAPPSKKFVEALKEMEFALS